MTASGKEESGKMTGEEAQRAEVMIMLGLTSAEHIYQDRKINSADWGYQSIANKSQNAWITSNL